MAVVLYFLALIPTSSPWLNLVERWFREIIGKPIRCGTLQNEAALTATIWNYIDARNQSSNVYVWTAPVERILTKISNFKEALDALH